jgi:nifR3 family TIM-barrel protein
MTNVQPEPTFWVRDVPVYGDVILSPMAGYSDVPYRAICRAYGSAMNYTEFVPVETLLGRRSNNRFWQRLDKKPDEHPIVFQIFGNNAQKILEAALRIEELEPDMIDINMGCSTRRVSGRGAGVGMMPQPRLVAETFQLLSSSLSVPVTGKIRLGWDDKHRNYAEIARIMEDNGASLVAMHARTKAQNYGGQADWDEIARLRQTVSVPVIGNGDVCTPEDIERMKVCTRCDAVMIGRAAIGNPWIFSRLKRKEITTTEIVVTIQYHLREMVSYYGEKLGVVLFRKHLKHYLAEMPEVQALLPRMLQTTSSQDLNDLIMKIADPAQVNLLLESGENDTKWITKG